MFRSQPKFYRVMFVLVLCLLIPACGRKVNKSNYDKITNGMTEKEVEAILGPGEEQASAGVNIPGISMSGKSKAWKDGTKAITISFLNGKVATKSQDGL